MRVGTLAEIWRYPVKSMQGEILARARLTSTGIPGDRGLAVVERDTGRVLSGKGLEELVTARATDDAIMLPDGRRIALADADEGLTGWLDRPVRLAPPTAGRPVIVKEAGRTFEGFGGTFFDAGPLHLVTTSTLRHLGTLYAGSFDRRRFRPNLLVDTSAPGPIERGWLGRDLRVGSIEVRVVAECSRCILTTSAQSELPKDRGILGTVEQEQEGVVGVYVEVASEGEVAAGDAVVLLP